MLINITFLRSHYPEFLGVRKFLQRIKVKRIRRHILPEVTIRKCEEYPEMKKNLIAPYVKKWKKYLEPAVLEMNMMLPKSPEFLRGGTTLMLFKRIFCFVDWHMDLFLQSIFLLAFLIRQSKKEKCIVLI